MGYILMWFLILTELIFAAWNIARREYHKREKGILHIVLLLLLVILSVVGVIQWGFRYYTLGIVLLVQAICGGIILWKKPTPKKFSYGKCFWRFVGKSILYSTSLTMAILLPQHKVVEQTGAFAVESTTATLVDENRVEIYDESGENRQINVQFWYPVEEKNCPLVVFSHGAYGIKLSNESLFRELASHGYVVCSIDHPYHSFFTINDQGKMTTISPVYMSQFQEASVTGDAAIVYSYMQEWMQVRSDDMNLVLDTILENAGDKIDRERIVAMGHSMGGAAAATLGRERDDIKAVVLLESPYMSDIIGLGEDAFVWTEEPYPLPALNIYSDTAWGKMQGHLMYVENEKMLLSGEDKWRSVYIEGVEHLGLTDLSLVCPIATAALDGKKGEKNPREALKEINEAVLAFLAEYVE